MNNKQTMYYGHRDACGDACVEKIKYGKTKALNMRFDLAYLSPDGPEWGYDGGGSAQLALAMVSDALGATCVGDLLAVAFYQEFKRQLIANLPQEQPWKISQDRVRREMIEIMQNLNYARARIDEAREKLLQRYIEALLIELEERSDLSIDCDKIQADFREKITKEISDVLKHKLNLPPAVCARLTCAPNQS
jgi:hypothetical protein